MGTVDRIALLRYCDVMDLKLTEEIIAANDVEIIDLADEFQKKGVFRALVAVTVRYEATDGTVWEGDDVFTIDVERE